MMNEWHTDRPPRDDEGTLWDGQRELVCLNANGQPVVFNTMFVQELWQEGKNRPWSDCVPPPPGEGEQVQPNVVDAVADAVDSHAVDITTIESRLDAMDERMQEFQSFRQRAAGWQGDTDTCIDELKGKIDATGCQAADLERALSEHIGDDDKRIDELERKVRQIDRVVTSHEVWKQEVQRWARGEEDGT